MGYSLRPSNLIKWVFIILALFVVSSRGHVLADAITNNLGPLANDGCCGSPDREIFGNLSDAHYQIYSISGYTGYIASGNGIVDVYTCINKTGIIFSPTGPCWHDTKTAGNSGHLDFSHSIQNLDPEKYTWWVVHTRVENSMDTTTYWSVVGRKVNIDNFTPRSGSVNVGDKIYIDYFASDATNGVTISYNGPITSDQGYADNAGLSCLFGTTCQGTLVFTATGNGTATFTLTAMGPGQNDPINGPQTGRTVSSTKFVSIGSPEATVACIVHSGSLTGPGINGATCTIAGHVGTTNSDGYRAFQVGLGTQTLNVTAPGYSDFTGTYQINGNIDLPVALTSGGGGGTPTPPPPPPPGTAILTCNGSSSVCNLTPGQQAVIHWDASMLRDSGGNGASNCSVQPYSGWSGVTNTNTDSNPVTRTVTLHCWNATNPDAQYASLQINVSSNPVPPPDSQDTATASCTVTVQAPPNPNAPGNADRVVPNYCLSGPGATITWQYSDPLGSPQTAYEVQVTNNGSFNSPIHDSGQVNSSGLAYTMPPGTLQFANTYLARIRVWNSAGGVSAWSASTPSWTTPQYPYPQVGFSWTPPRPGQNAVVSFSDLTSFGGGSPAGRQWSWNFGDGGTSGVQNSTHAFAAIGNFTVTETATDAANQSCSIQRSISVQKPVPIIKEVAPQ